MFRCMSCGADAPKWAGQCSGCGDWNTLAEELDVPSPASVLAQPPTPPVPITAVRSSDGRPVPTGLAEVDRVLGGGLVPGSVTLVGGEPGVGKSTLVLQLMGARARAGATVLYVTGEESADQVRLAPTGSTRCRSTCCWRPRRHCPTSSPTWTSSGRRSA